MGSGNTPCRVEFVDGLRGLGQPVRNVVTLRGQSWAPVRENLIVDPVGVACSPDRCSCVLP